MTHTAGPWFVSDLDRVTVYVKKQDQEPGICSCDGSGITPLSPDQQEANAQLISAAPELLELVKMYRKSHCGKTGYVSSVSAKPTLCAKCLIAEAAIAKAEGKI